MFKRFRNWVKLTFFQKLFDAVRMQSDMQYFIVDTTIVRVYQQKQSAKGGVGQTIGRSRGGLTTKILALTDALGCLLRFVLLGGQRHDLQGVEELLEGVDLRALLAENPSMHTGSSNAYWHRPAKS